MAFVILIIGAILVVVAYNDTAGQLATALKQDVQPYLKWALAIAAILALGFIPGMKTPSRYLLGLVAVVILVTNYKQIIAGIEAFTGVGSLTPTPSAQQTVGQGTVAPDPTLSGATGGQTAASLGGDAPVVIAPTGNSPPATPSPFDPNTYLAMFSTSATGFGSSA